jgi:alkylation response protein AidB-like acyl-CoA dehydrogenase
MDLSYTPEEEAFRAEVRAFAIEKIPEAIRDKVRRGRHLEKADFVTAHKAFAERGWSVPGWPEELGGCDWTAVQKHIFDEELALASVPGRIPFGTNMAAPVIIEFGSEAQKERFLPPIRSGDEWWCQGFSEPGAGSDLASLTTRAVLDGDHYIINGQKTWTTLAQYADWIFCLVRTDTEVKQQEGISFILIDMKTPGITVRPIILLDGRHEVNEVFFEDVRVPVENRVGEENKGWTYAKHLLSHERTGIARVGHSKHQLGVLKQIATSEQSEGRSLIDDPYFRAKIAELEMDLMALEMTNLRVIAAADGPTPLEQAGMLKIRGTEIQQRLTELIMEAVGPAGQPYQPEALGDRWNEPTIGPDYAAPAAPTYFNWRKSSIYGGSNEIQKTIIAKVMLG